jgi:hypothetical protein
MGEPLGRAFSMLLVARIAGSPPKMVEDGTPDMPFMAS